MQFDVQITSPQEGTQSTCNKIKHLGKDCAYVPGYSFDFLQIYLCSVLLLLSKYSLGKTPQEVMQLPPVQYDDESTAFCDAPVTLVRKETFTKKIH